MKCECEAAYCPAHQRTTCDAQAGTTKTIYGTRLCDDCAQHMPRDFIKEEVRWFGGTPDRCDLCREPIRSEFIDGKVQAGPWGIMCPRCFIRDGAGLGTGLGQRYQLNGHGHFVKVEG